MTSGRTASRSWWGSVIGREGFPLAHEVFAGNVQDCQTLGIMLDRLKTRIGLAPGVTVVWIGEWPTPKTSRRSAIDNLGITWSLVTAGTRPMARRILRPARVPRRRHREPSPWNLFQKKSEVRVKIWCIKGTSVGVLCTSSQRVAKDRAICSKQGLCFLADVESLRQRIAKGRSVREVAIGEAIGRLKGRHPRVAPDDLSFLMMPLGVNCGISPDEAKKAKAERLDGGYLLGTDRKDLTGPEAWLLAALR